MILIMILINLERLNLKLVSFIQKLIVYQKNQSFVKNQK